MPASCLALILGLVAVELEMPQVHDPRLQIQLVAAEPDIVTPTALAVDARGRVLVIESHTHFRPENYQGPLADRILLLADFDPATGRARKISTFFEGTTHTMNLLIAPDGDVYVATRMEVFRLRDTDGDGRADERTPICHLETPGNYPHNGLSGLALDGAGHLYIGFGENLGAEYKLVGSDGLALAGGGEGGNIYACDRQGRALRRIATGFWNPFGLAFDHRGHLFAVDNDPDSRPPCRLLHIVEGGDYGFRFRNGRKGVHPFTAWNGELPGTLPMVSGTGEAPCSVLEYTATHLPAEYRGSLLVTSWGDHRLEQYRLQPRGASFSAVMTPLVRGGENFRPVGLAVAPDGSLYLSDWVSKSYPLHGLGRVWRVSASSSQPPAADVAAGAAATESAQGRALPQPVLHADLGGLERAAAVASADPFVRQAAIERHGAALAATTPDALRAMREPLARLAVAIAARRSDRAEGRAILPVLLDDPSPEVRLYAVIWIGEEQLADQRANVEQLLTAGGLNRQLFEAALACLDRLAVGAPRDPKAESPGEAFLARLLADERAEPTSRRMALRALRPDHPALTRERLAELAAQADAGLRLEAIRTIRQRPDSERFRLVRKIAADEAEAAAVRCEAVVGLSPGNDEDRKLLLTLAENAAPEVADEALRALRGFDLTADEKSRLAALAGRLEGPHRELAERALLRNPPKNLPRRDDMPAWLAMADGPGNRQAGERIFYHPRVGGCFRCHEYAGRGFTVGPDLTTIGRALTRERLIQSLVDPSREMAPQFTPLTILTLRGEVLTGIHVGDEVDGRMRLADQNGRAFYVRPDEIERRIASSQSIMPEGLVDNLTPQELRDLVAFLMQ